MHKFYFLIIFFVFNLKAKAQPIICAHTQSFYFENGNAVASTFDGGYIIAGLTAEYGSSVQGEAYLVKFDSLNNIQWAKTFGNTFQSTFYDVIQTIDGGYAATGYYESQTSVSHILIIKTDSAGNLQWKHTIGSAANDNGFVINQMPDSGYAVTGHTFTNCVWTVRISKNGVIEWVRRLTGAGSKLGLGAVVGSDGAIMACGYSSGVNSVADPNALLIKYYPDGNLAWSKVFGNTKAELFHTIENSHTDGFFLGGFITDTMVAPANMMLLAKTDTSGNILWAKGIGGQYDDRIRAIIKTSDGNYCASAFSIIDTTGIDTYNDILFKFNESGNILWMKKRTEFTGDISNSLKETTSGKLVSTGNYFADVAVVVADSNGNSCCYTNYSMPDYLLTLNQTTVGNIDSNYNTYAQTFTQAAGGTLAIDCVPVGLSEDNSMNEEVVYPNPAQNIVTLSFKDKTAFLFVGDKLILVDLTGKKVFEKTIKQACASFVIPVSMLSPGMYQLTLISKQKVGSYKIIVTR